MLTKIQARGLPPSLHEAAPAGQGVDAPTRIQAGARGLLARKKSREKAELLATLQPSRVRTNLFESLRAGDELVQLGAQLRHSDGKAVTRLQANVRGKLSRTSSQELREKLMRGS